MPNPAKPLPANYVHAFLDNGVEFAADLLPERNTVALCFRMLTGVIDDPPELTGLSHIVERTMTKGTEHYGGRELADAFDLVGAQWATTSGRQSTLVRVLCLPEYVLDTVDLVGEMLTRPTFPEQACDVAVELAQQDLRNIEDEPQDLLRIIIQRLTLGPELGRYPGGTPESLAKLTPTAIRQHWKRTYHAGRLQIAAAGPVDAHALAQRLEQVFSDFGNPQTAGRDPLPINFQPAREHRQKDLEQQYLAITLPGLPRHHEDFAIEQVLIGVLSGGMSGRLFTEVREKQGLVYWVGAWHEQTRASGAIHLGASTTPERVQQTYDTLMREIRRLSDDLTEEEVRRACQGLIAQARTEDDLTRARASSLCNDLFFFGRPLGLGPKIRAVRSVTLSKIEDYVRRMPRDQICVATLGPRPL